MISDESWDWFLEQYGEVYTPAGVISMLLERVLSGNAGGCIWNISGRITARIRKHARRAEIPAELRSYLRMRLEVRRMVRYDLDALTIGKAGESDDGEI